MTRRVVTIILVAVVMSTMLTAQQPDPAFEVASIKLWRPPTTPLMSVRVTEARPRSAGQRRAESPTFEVASIRPNREVSDRPTLMRPILQPGGRVLMRNQTLHDLILTAYGVNENQLVGGPAWIRDSSFDLDARGAADMSAETARAMLRTLLAERFSLAVHREQRELPIYILTMAARAGQLGPRLRQASASCAAATRPQGMPPAPMAPPPKGIVDAIPLVAPGAPARCPSIFRDGHFSGRAVAMEVLAGELSDATGRRVVNRTGLKGEFDLDLIYTADLSVPRNPDVAMPPALMTAIQEQLGLKLEAGRGPVEVLVIDSVERPTPN